MALACVEVLAGGLVPSAVTERTSPSRSGVATDRLTVLPLTVAASTGSDMALPPEGVKLTL